MLFRSDFAAFCPRPHLLEKPAPPSPPRFCHYSTDPVRCSRCLARDFPGLPPTYQAERRNLARQLLAAAVAVVHASPFLARAHGDLFGEAGASNVQVIPPAPFPASTAVSIRPPSPRSTAATRIHKTRASNAPAPPHHVAWVGAVQAHKGALVFEAAVECLAATRLSPRLSAYGGGDPMILRRWRRLPGLQVRGYYRSGSLPAMLRRDHVDLALLLSVVPESYSLVLDECSAAAVPVVAFDLGAFGDRLAAGAGLLLPAPLADDPTAGGAALADLLADLRDGRRQLPFPPADPIPKASSPAAAWIALYERLRLTTATRPSQATRDDSPSCTLR